LNLHIDADSALTQADDFARYREVLPLFLDAMLREEALTLAAAEAVHGIPSGGLRGDCGRMPRRLRGVRLDMRYR
jgi:hypothetical protein